MINSDEKTSAPAENRPAWNTGGRPRGVWAGQQGEKAPSAAAPAASVPDGEHCYRCHKKLERDEIGLHRKLVNRGAREYLCKTCLAAHFKMTIEDCDTLIANFKEAGCSMFC